MDSPLKVKEERRKKKKGKTGLPPSLIPTPWSLTHTPPEKNSHKASSTDALILDCGLQLSCSGLPPVCVAVSSTRSLGTKIHRYLVTLPSPRVRSTRPLLPRSLSLIIFFSPLSPPVRHQETNLRAKTTKLFEVRFASTRVRRSFPTCLPQLPNPHLLPIAHRCSVDQLSRPTVQPPTLSPKKALHKEQTGSTPPRRATCKPTSSLFPSASLDGVTTAQRFLLCTPSAPTLVRPLFFLLSYTPPPTPPLGQQGT